MYELAIEEHIQKKVRESVQKVLKKHENKLTYESVSEMDYLEQCVNEALRKYPPAANTQRVAKEDYSVANTRIVLEKGTSVMIPIYAIHHDPEIYPKPEIYDPDRFSPENVKQRHQYAFLPFGELGFESKIIFVTKTGFIISGEGPRICIGMR